MKTIHAYFVLFIISWFAFASCHKSNETIVSNASLTADSLSFNTITHQFSPDTSVSGTINSQIGVRLVYFYLVRGGVSDSLIYFDTASVSNSTTYTFNIPNAIFSNVNLNNILGIRVVAKLVNNSTYIGFVPISPFTPPLPSFNSFPDTLHPDPNGGTIQVTGNVESESGLTKIVIYDDYSGSYTPVDSIVNLNGFKSYHLDFSYNYRQYATHLMITAYDIYNLTSSFIIYMPVLPYTVYKDVTMMGQGTSSTPSTSCFFMDNAQLIGNCDISGREDSLAFLCYVSSSLTLYFYSPSNVTNIAKNYYCNGTSWSAPNASTLPPTRFQVLVPGSSSAVDKIYSDYNNNSITTLDDSYFSGLSAPSSSTVKYDPNVSNESSNVFNLTSAYLIWIRIYYANGTYKNALMRVKSININPDSGSRGLSTITFDIMIQH